MMNFYTLADIPLQFAFTLLSHLRALRFINERKLWSGIWRYGWLTKFMIVVGILIGLKMFSRMVDWWKELQQAEAGLSLQGMGAFFQNMASEGYNLLFASGSKYIVLVLLEVLIFHFSRRTVLELSGRDTGGRFGQFLNSQIRMIKVAFRSWVFELLWTIGLGIALGIFSFLEFLKPALIFGVQCYFLGFAMVDSYFEQQNITIAESARRARPFAGVVLAVGFMFYLLVHIPVAGAVAGAMAAPILTAVAASMVMYEYEKTRNLTPGEPAVPEEEEVP